MYNIHTTKIEKLRPLNDTVLVTDMYFGERITHSGIVLLNDDMKNEGIRPRWGKVYAVGPKAPEEIEVGKWIYVSHGRWSRGIAIEDSEGKKFTIRKVDNNDILLISDNEPEDYNISDKVI